MAERYILKEPEEAQLPRLAEIQKAAFAEDPLVLGALPGVAHEDYIAWVTQNLTRPRPPPGYRMELVCAVKEETGEIVGFAQWAIPTKPGDEPAALGAPVPFPRNGHEHIWQGFFEGVVRIMNEVMGEAKHWSAFDPVYPSLILMFKSCTSTGHPRHRSSISAPRCRPSVGAMGHGQSCRAGLSHLHLCLAEGRAAIR
jgi:hypothetical protein